MGRIGFFAFCLITLFCFCFLPEAYCYRIDAVQVESGNIIVDSGSIEITSSSSVSGGTVLVQTTGTARQLSTSSVPTKKVILRATPNNVGNVYVGDSAVMNGTIGVYLTHANSTTGNMVTIDVGNLSSLYINGVVGDGVDYLAILE